MARCVRAYRLFGYVLGLLWLVCCLLVAPLSLSFWDTVTTGTKVFTFGQEGVLFFVRHIGVHSSKFGCCLFTRVLLRQDCSFDFKGTLSVATDGSVSSPVLDSSVTS